MNGLINFPNANDIDFAGSIAVAIGFLAALVYFMAM